MKITIIWSALSILTLATAGAAAAAAASSSPVQPAIEPSRSSSAAAAPPSLVQPTLQTSHNPPGGPAIINFSSIRWPPNPPLPGNDSNSSTTLYPPHTTPRYRGFNVPNHIGGHSTPKKNQTDWLRSFNRIKSIPGNNAARVYSTQDDGVPYLPSQLLAAQESNITLLLGVYLGWNDPSGIRFTQEFDVLKDALRTHGIRNVMGIGVGNEDLYFKHSTPDLIAAQVVAVQDWLDIQFPGECVPVGHADTWGEVVDPANKAVAEVSDFLVANVFPYWEGARIDDASDYFVAAARNLSAFEQREGVEVWFGETGWPVSAKPAMGMLGVPGTDGLQRYWTDVVCGAEWQAKNAFFYVDQDDGDEPAWGVFDGEGRARIDMTCPGPV